MSAATCPIKTAATKASSKVFTWLKCNAVFKLLERRLVNRKTGVTSDHIIEVSSRGKSLRLRIEFSTIDKESGQKIHALGLGIDLENKVLREKCTRLRTDRIKLMGQIAEKLASYGFVLRVDELVASGEIITKAHIARDVFGE